MKIEKGYTICECCGTKVMIPFEREIDDSRLFKVKLTNTFKYIFFSNHGYVWRLTREYDGDDKIEIESVKTGVRFYAKFKNNNGFKLKEIFEEDK